jgi:Integrase zinc binding domain
MHFLFTGHHRAGASVTEQARVRQLATRFVPIPATKQVMFRRNPEGPLVLIPRWFERKRRLQELHHTLLFCGADKLYQAAKGLYYWPRLLRDSKQVVVSSPVVKRMKAKFSVEKYLYPTYKGARPF